MEGEHEFDTLETEEFSGIVAELESISSDCLRHALMKIVRGASSGSRARICWMKSKRSSGGVASKSMSRMIVDKVRIIKF